jgi:hypothetical protein
LVALAAGRRAADLGAPAGGLVSTSPTSKVKRVSQPAKARYLVALLVGPVYQCFDGAPGARDSGLRRATTTGPTSEYIDKVFEMVKVIAKASVDLLNSGTRQLPGHEKELADAVGALREFLASNGPDTRRLVQDGVEYPPPDADTATAAPTAETEKPAAKPARAATSGKARSKRP